MAVLTHFNWSYWREPKFSGLLTWQTTCGNPLDSLLTQWKTSGSSGTTHKVPSPWKSIFVRFLSFLTPLESFPCSELDLKIVLWVSGTENRSKCNAKHWRKKMLTLWFFEKIKTFHILSSWHHDGCQGWLFFSPSRSQFTHGEFGVSH